MVCLKYFFATFKRCSIISKHNKEISKNIRKRKNINSLLFCFNAIKFNYLEYLKNISKYIKYSETIKYKKYLNCFIDLYNKTLITKQCQFFYRRKVYLKYFNDIINRNAFIRSMKQNEEAFHFHYKRYCLWKLISSLNAIRRHRNFSVTNNNKLIRNYRSGLYNFYCNRNNRQSLKVLYASSLKGIVCCINIVTKIN